MADPATTAALVSGGFGLLGGLLGGSGRPDPNYSYGFSGSSGFGVSGSQQQSSSVSVQNPDFVWGIQSPYLQDLYGQAQSTLAGQGGAQGLASQRIDQGFGALSDLMQPGMNPMMEVYQRQLQQGLESYILPTIRREAQGAGMLGGSRQGVAEGLALQESIRQQGDFAAQLYGQDRDRMLQAAAQVPAMAQAGLGVPWYGLNQYAGILGSPTVLGGGGYSESQSTGSSFGQEASESFGEQFGGPNPDILPPNLPGSTSPPTGGSGGFQGDQGPRSNR